MGLFIYFFPQMELWIPQQETQSASWKEAAGGAGGYREGGRGGGGQGRSGGRQAIAYRSCNLSKRPHPRCEHLTCDQGRTSQGEELSVHGKSGLLTAASTERGAPQASTDGPPSLEEDQVTADFPAELAGGLTACTPTHGTPRPPRSPVRGADPPGKGPGEAQCPGSFWIHANKLSQARESHCDTDLPARERAQRSGKRSRCGKGR